MFEPSNEDILNELLAQSHLLYGSAGLGGVLGPLKSQYDNNRPDGWPHSKSVLRMFGLERNAKGWRYLLQAFGLIPPDNSEIQTSSRRRREPSPTKPSIPQEDESYPELVGSLVDEVIELTPLGDGRFRRTTTSVIQLR